MQKVEPVNTGFRFIPHLSNNADVDFSKESIIKDIKRNMRWGKPCAIAKITNGKVEIKWHVFH